MSEELGKKKQVQSKVVSSGPGNRADFSGSVSLSDPATATFSSNNHK